MNDFRQITAIAVDCINPTLAAQALERSMAQCDFAEAILLTDTPVPTEAKVRTIPPVRSRTEYSRFCLRDMAEHVSTPYLLIVQWDGFVLDAGQWDSEFLKWDYIGAPWPTRAGPEVGNGGFCLRSRRLLDALADPVFDEPEVELEDQFICREHRALLEQRHGVRFAPVPLARRFSYDSYLPARSTFGVHGLYNLWRHLPETEFETMVRALHPRSLTGVGFINLLIVHMNDGRYAMAQHLLRMALDLLAGADLEAGLEMFRRTFEKPPAGDTFVATCRQLLALRVPAG